MTTFKIGDTVEIVDESSCAKWPACKGLIGTVDDLDFCFAKETVIVAFTKMVTCGRIWCPFDANKLQLADECDEYFEVDI